MLHERPESAEDAVAFTRVLDGHDALADDVARAQVELAASLVAVEVLYMNLYLTPVLVSLLMSLHLSPMPG